MTRRIGVDDRRAQGGEPPVRESGAGRRVWLATEYLLLFVALPLLWTIFRPTLPLLPTLWLFSLGCLLYLLADRDFDRRHLWNARRAGRELARAALPFLLLAPLLALGLLLWEPERLLAFVRQRPLLWAAVMVLYPVLSAYPQGVIYRVFLFHRYRTLFPGRWPAIVASAVAFALVHIIFHNAVAPPLSLVGGLLFASTYDRTRSSLVATFQHALFGCFIFTIGWGWYFYHGALRP
jgi:membrane protease YdiL (CAAX protease family)